jgi:hypothetical protein
LKRVEICLGVSFLNLIRARKFSILFWSISYVGLVEPFPSK